jgi:pyruvate/2-oxoglutarate dehydrogenase complex dihydrolipoamide acyltransferase (E2) component
METILIDVPMPSMGATVHELTIISLRVAPGAQVAKGQKVAELESDKSVFEFESPCEGTVRAILGAPGEVKASGSPFLQIETRDATLKHLESKGRDPAPAPAAAPAAKLVWTPRALKMAQEAGLVPDQVADIEPTGPGSRVSGDDVARYLEKRK